LFDMFNYNSDDNEDWKQDMWGLHNEQGLCELRFVEVANIQYSFLCSIMEDINGQTMSWKDTTGILMVCLIHPNRVFLCSVREWERKPLDGRGCTKTH
jgi:hypothetical protein